VILNLFIIKLIRLICEVQSSGIGCFVIGHLLYLSFVKFAARFVSVKLFRDRIILKFGKVLVKVVGTVCSLECKMLVGSYRLELSDLMKFEAIFMKLFVRIFGG
jgi:hypothetical protein